MFSRSVAVFGDFRGGGGGGVEGEGFVLRLGISWSFSCTPLGNGFGVPLCTVRGRRLVADERSNEESDMSTAHRQGTLQPCLLGVTLFLVEGPADAVAFIKIVAIKWCVERECDLSRAT